MANPLREVRKFGQSIWYESLRRGLITAGELQNLIDRDGLLGITSNLTLFALTISGCSDYDQPIKALAGAMDSGPEIYEQLTLEDIRLAADVFYPIYVRSAGRDGLVSLEISPHLANDTKSTIEEARQLHALIRRDNVLIKIPATPAGLPALEQLISEGIGIHVTGLFSPDIYEQAATAYLAGLEKYDAKGGEVAKVASVAGFCLSRVDTLVDALLEQRLNHTTDPVLRKKLKGLVGKAALANARLAYFRYLKLHATERWKALAARKALPQRLLWARTSTKNPRYSRTFYVEELIGPDTVNLLGGEALKTFRRAGRARPSLTENWAESLDQAREILGQLGEVGISLAEVSQRLLADEVHKQTEAFDRVLAAIEGKRQTLLGQGLDPQTYVVGEHTRAVQETLEEWRVDRKVRRLWAGDTALWSATDEDRWLGWLNVVESQREHCEHFRDLAEEVRSSGFQQVVLLGMGGSSLGPEVLRRAFGRIKGFPELLLLDSTVPAQVLSVARRIDPARTLFLVSSKSGGTTEPNVFKQYFLEQVRQAVGPEKAGAHFLAITDAGTKLHAQAKNDRFRHIFFGVPEIGGRFSVLSNFGMIPATLMGLDVGQLLQRTEVMVHACASCVPPELNPGVILGAVLGTLAQEGHDKVTFILSPRLASLGAWLEQLLAESTGKEGKGLIPVDGEKVGSPSVYGEDRLFVYIRLKPAASAEQDAAVEALEKADHPVVRIALADLMDLGQELFRWEIATAVAGSILGINAFNQPDVEAAKVAARTLTAAYEQQRTLPADTALVRDNDLALFADPRTAQQLAAAARAHTVEGFLAAHLDRIVPGDYFALNAYLEMNESHDRELQALRHNVRDSRQVATTLGYGPRYLHSTGQLHKGGPNRGVFLLITADDAEDLPIPGRQLTFGVLKQAQALGDLSVLAERERRVLRVHLGADVTLGLSRLRQMVQRLL